MKYKTIEEAIKADIRKEKFKDYCSYIPFYNLKYEEMNKIFAIIPTMMEVEDDTKRDEG